MIKKRVIFSENMLMRYLIILREEKTDFMMCCFHPEEAEIYIRMCTFGDTMESDSFGELCEADERYRITNRDVYEAS